MNKNLISVLKVLSFKSNLQYGRLSYEEIKRIVDNAKKPLVKIGNNTWLLKTNKGYGIKYHNTVIIEILPHDLYVLNVNGWETSTTKQRMNQLLPVYIYSEKGVWYFNKSGDRNKKNRVAYEDGMIINKDGDVVG